MVISSASTAAGPFFLDSDRASVPATMVARSLIGHRRILWRRRPRVGILVPALRGNRVRTLPLAAPSRSTPHRTIRRPAISRRRAVVRTLRLPVRRLARGRVLSECPLVQLLYTARHSLPSLFIAVGHLHALISPIFVITWRTPRRTLAPGTTACGSVAMASRAMTNRLRMERA